MLNIDVEIYIASEINKDAIDVAIFNHGNTIEHKGNIIELSKDDEYLQSIAPIHLIIGGSPCNELSKANSNGLGLGEFLILFSLILHAAK